MFQFLIIFCIVFEVLTVVRICNVVWVRTPYSLVHIWLCMFWRNILGLSTQAIMMEAVSPGHIVCADHLDCTVPYLRRTQFLILILYIFHASCHFVTKLMYTCQAIHSAVILHYTLVWAEMCSRNIITNSTVYCLMSVCSCFVMVLKFYIFRTVMHSRRGVVMVWQVATLPMRYIVRRNTTRSDPLSHTDYLKRTQPYIALWFFVSTEIPIHTSSKLWYLGVGTTKSVQCMKVLICDLWERHYLGWRTLRFLSTNM